MRKIAAKRSVWTSGSTPFGEIRRDFLIVLNVWNYRGFEAPTLKCVELWAFSSGMAPKWWNYRTFCVFFSPPKTRILTADFTEFTDFTDLGSGGRGRLRVVRGKNAGISRASRGGRALAHALAYALAYAAGKRRLNLKKARGRAGEPGRQVLICFKRRRAEDSVALPHASGRFPGRDYVFKEQSTEFVRASVFCGEISPRIANEYWASHSGDNVRDPL
jgi:hypothetical protein